VPSRLRLCVPFRNPRLQVWSINNDPKLVALAILVRKYAQISGGAYEIFITSEDFADFSSFGELVETKDEERKRLSLRYYPNPTIEGEGGLIESTGVKHSGEK